MRDVATIGRTLAKGWTFFDIMHKDRKVARIHEDGRCSIYFPSFMPYNLYLEEGDDVGVRANNFANFYYWCSSRVLTLDRKYAKEILSAIGATQASTDKDRAAIAISYHGLSLMDVYWIRGKSERRTFADLSLFRHSLSGAFVDICLRGKLPTSTNEELYVSRNIAADLGTPGVAPKAWTWENGGFYLLKDGDIRDVEAELLASKIARCFAFDSVPYEESYFDGNKVSKCPIITSEERSIVSEEYVEVYCANKEIDTLEFVCHKDKYNYHMMNIVDYLVGNIDRHWGNWGFYVDNKTNRLLGLYPLMDFNKSFLAYDSLNGTLCHTRHDGVLQKDAALEGVRQIGLNLVKPIEESWFADEATKDMLFKRLNFLKEADQKA